MAGIQCSDVQANKKAYRNHPELRTSDLQIAERRHWSVLLVLKK